MNDNKQIVGVIDIGTTKIVALIGENINEHTYRVLGYGHVVSKGVARGNVVNVVSTVEGILQALDIAQKQAQVTISEVYVGIAGQNITTITNTANIERENPNKEITKEEIDKIIKKQFHIPTYNGEQIIEVIPKSIYIDDHEINRIEDLVGCVGKDLKISFNLVIGKAQNIKTIETCIEKANLKLKQIFLEPIASSRAVLHPYERNKGVVMIDIGGGTSDIAVYYKDMLIHTAVIPFGGNVITSDIEKSFNITFDDAEYLKENFGQAILLEEEESKQLVLKNKIEGKESIVIDSNVLSSVIQARVEEILGFIEYELVNNAKLNTKNISDVVITGGGSKLKYLNQLIKYKLSMDSRIGLPNIYLKNNSDDKYKNPQYSTAIGLMILAIEDILTHTEKTTEITNTKEQFSDKNENINTTHKKTKKTKKLKESLYSIFNNMFKDNDSELEK
jgi:cell division protein FtsA